MSKLQDPNKGSITVDGSTLTLTRLFQAPRELVFSAFTEADHLKHWWGPRGWEITVCEMDFRPGGSWHYCMKCMDKGQGDFYGMESWGKAIYHQIEAPEKIIYTDYFSDADGNESAEMPATNVTLTFEEADGYTRVVNRAEYVSPEALQTVLDMGMEQGISETWSRLDEYLQTAKS
ncbi:SRPBCC domain-containing protein [Marinicrinis sediminis]|uniref:SRPBCC domain-containing protein n=1 Tax=Marinicrinis sediminis TaxID=1652465 RepID=A0ABW5R9K3_9BACL